MIGKFHTERKKTKTKKGLRDGIHQYLLVGNKKNGKVGATKEKKDLETHLAKMGTKSFNFSFYSLYFSSSQKERFTALLN